MSTENEIRKLFDAWDAALRTGDPNKVVDLYALNAVLVPTVSNDVRTNRAEIRDYFVEFIKEKKPKGARLDEPNIRFFGDIAINSGIYTFYLGDDSTPTQARYTYVYNRSEGPWLIVEHHSSLLYKEMVRGEPLFDMLRIE